MQNLIGNHDKLIDTRTDNGDKTGNTCQIKLLNVSRESEKDNNFGDIRKQHRKNYRRLVISEIYRDTDSAERQKCRNNTDKLEVISHLCRDRTQTRRRNIDRQSAGSQVNLENLCLLKTVVTHTRGCPQIVDRSRKEFCRKIG